MEALSGRTSIQALVAELEEGKFVWRIQTNPAGHVTHLVFVSRYGLDLFAAYLEVLLLDCTYQTNRFQMPLLDMVGLIGLNTTFYVAFAFVKSEQEEDFTWVLKQLQELLRALPSVVMTDRELALMNAIRNVFPAAHSLLCQWHIQKNILAKCKRHFISEEEANNKTDAWTGFQQNWA